METMILTVNKTVTEEKEISLPYFTKVVIGGEIHSASMIFSKEQCIHITGGEWGDISIANAGLALHSKSQVECTKEEFFELYDKVNAKLRDIVLTAAFPVMK